MSSNETHLQLIQGVVGRMAQNSFALKGWAVTLISALFALAAKDQNTRIAFVAYIPAIAFWALDAYYLLQERLFRALYDVVRISYPPKDSSSDFSMDTKAAAQSAATTVQAKLHFYSTLLSVTELGFYGPLLAAVTAGAWLLGAF